MGEVKVSARKQFHPFFTAVLIAVAGWAAPSRAEAQSPAPGAVPPIAAAVQSPAGSSAEETATRYVKAEDRATYVAKVFSTFAMSQRAFDPFGRNQDPNYHPPQPEISRPDTADSSQHIPQASLSDLVSGIQVTMLMPTKQTFFVGDRAFHRGDRFPLRTPAGTLVNVEILSVNPTSIVFRETSKGEVGVLRLGGSPEGVRPGRTLETPPGITVPNPAAPLDLQPAQDPNSSR